MSPYREGPQLASAPTRVRRKSVHKGLGLALIASTPLTSGLAGEHHWVLAVNAFVLVVGIVLAVVGRSRNPLTRLAQLTWNRGDRFIGAMLWLGVQKPSYSKKRIARSQAAMAAQQQSMPQQGLFMTPKDIERWWNRR